MEMQDEAEKLPKNKAGLAGPRKLSISRVSGVQKISESYLLSYVRLCF
jgi:hypothetical protein